MPTLSAGAKTKNKSVRKSLLIGPVATGRRHSESHTNGFTLLELLVVLTIISISVAIVGPRFLGPMSGMQLRTSAKKMAASLRYARSLATAEKTPYVAQFDIDKGQLSLKATPDETDEALEADPESDGDGPVTIKPRVFSLPEGVRLEKALSIDSEVDSGIFEIIFSPNGNTSGGAVILTNERGRHYKISVDLVMGTVTLEEA